jgi:lipopolysaccharide exporter
VQNAAWMFSSSGLSILLQFIFFFILSHIYQPDDYGLFGIFNVYASTLGNLASFGFNQAFVLPKAQDKFKQLLHLTFMVSTATCLLFAFTMMFWSEQLLTIFGHNELGWLIHLAAPIAWLMVMDRLASDWAIRIKSFKNQLWTSVTSTILSRGYNVTHGLLIAPDAVGLIITTAIQHISRVALYLRFVIPNKPEKWWRGCTWQQIKQIGATYWRYPTYVHWSNVLVVFSASLPAGMLPLYGYSLSDIGYYVHALVLLDIPIRLMGSGIASVFTQKAADQMHHRFADDGTDRLLHQCQSLFSYMLVMSLAFLMIVLIAGQWGYALVFGTSWSAAGVLAEILVVHYFFRMISSPLSALFFVLHAEKTNFYFHLSLTFARVGILWCGGIQHWSFTEIMLGYAVINGLWYLAYLAIIWRLLGAPIVPMLSKTLLYTGLIMTLALMIRCFLFDNQSPWLTLL